MDHSGVELDLAAAAREVPDHSALVYPDGEFGFRELHAQVCADLESLQLDPKRAMPVLGTLTPDAFVAVHAAIKARVALLPLHPKWSAEERAALVETWSAHDVPEGTLAVVPTSGSTGTPKGVLLSREAFVASARASRRRLGGGSNERWLLCLPLAHIGGLSVLTRALVDRTTVVIAPFDPVGFSETVSRHAITAVSLVPTMLAQVLESDPQWRAPPHLRLVLLGGDAASEALLDEAAARGVVVAPTYGLTEACGQVATCPPGERPRPGRVGPVLEGLQLRLAADGTIEVRGPMVSTGYFPPGAHPGPLEDGWLNTGDLGVIDDDGWLGARGRRDERIVTGGENVYPAEVERVLETHPEVRAVCVVGLPDEEWGQVVGALLECRGGVPEDFQGWAKARLPAHRRPRVVRAVTALPRTASGKPDLRAVRAVF